MNESTSISDRDSLCEEEMIHARHSALHDAEVRTVAEVGR
jgi:hypothetical protein